jgi:hypothetical protein
LLDLLHDAVAVTLLIHQREEDVNGEGRERKMSLDARFSHE